MKIGILATGTTRDSLLPRFGSYADMFVSLLSEQDASLEFEVFDVRDGIFPASTKVCDAWLITGSRSNVYERLPWMLQLNELILKIDAKKQPLVGICFGHQIIADVLGGTVVKFAGGWGVGIHQYETVPESIGLVTSKPLSHFSICAMHQDQVTTKPARAEVFARSEFCENAGLVYGKHIVSLQGHPEFNKTYETALIENLKGDVFSLDVAEQGLQSVESSSLDSLQVIVWLLDFMKSACQARIA